MLEQNKRRIGQQLESPQYAGKPVFFFDTSFLLANVTSLAGWSQTRLEAALAPRVEKILSAADARIVAENGFYVIFASGDTCVAGDTAKAICDDILRHFYGDRKYNPEDVDKLCRESSVHEVAKDLEISLASERGASHQRRKRQAPEADDLPESEKERLLFKQELTELFMEHVSSRSKSGKFLFSPCWDSKKKSITSFVCEPAAQTVNLPVSDPGAIGLPGATAQCKLDIMALAVATKGIRCIVSRDEVAAVSVPVHIETLSWLKTRSAYFEMLVKIDSRYLALLATRITGLNSGSNLSPIARWIRGLRRYVRWNFVNLPDVNFDLSRAGGLGVTGFGVNLTSSMRAAGAPLETLATLATKLKRICVNQSAIACVGKVASLHELFLLNSHGIRIISGPVIGKPSELPGPIMPLSFSDASPVPQAEAG